MMFIGFPHAILTMVTLGPGVGPQGPTGELSEGPGAWALAANLYSARCGVVGVGERLGSTTTS